MIIGSGMLAKAFAAQFARVTKCLDICSGRVELQLFRSVVNLPVKARGCWKRLSVRTRRCVCLLQHVQCKGSGCSRILPYVRHKIEMERLVSDHAKFVIVRLPQVAGRTPNPHTLLNYLYARVARSEKFFGLDQSHEEHH